MEGDSGGGLVGLLVKVAAAIGWLPARWLNQNLKEIAIVGIDPSAQIIPVLAVTPGNPLDDTQKWLQCLQTTFGN